MFGKILNFLFLMGACGILAIFIALVIYIVFAIAITFAMIPVVILAGSETSNFITNSVLDLKSLRFFPIIYAVVFLLLMANALGIPKIKKI